MNVIEMAISDAIFSIDETVLDIAFFKGRGVNLSSLRDRIKELVIYPYVLPHINAESGHMLYIPINSMKVVSTNEQGIEVIIDDPQLQGREIVTPVSLIDGAGISQVAGTEDTFSREIHTNITLLHKNTVYIHGALHLPSDAVLKCSVTYTDTLNEIPPGANTDFSEFINLAIKVYIYKTVNRLVEQGFIYQGAELTSIANIVSEYSTAIDDYNLMRREVIPKVLDMSSTKFMENYVGMMFDVNI